MSGIFAIAAAVPVAVLLLYAVTRPDTFRVQRAAGINAPPELKLFGERR